MIKKYPMPISSTEADIKEAVKLAIKGEYSYPFLVVGLAPTMFKTWAGVCTYQFVISPTQEDTTGTIDREIAKKIIKANEMERVHSDMEGRVYESPNRPFLAIWEGYYATKKLGRLWHFFEDDYRFPCQSNKSLIWARYVGEDKVEIHAPAEVISFFKQIEKDAQGKAGLAFKRFSIGRKVMFKAN